jgi:hypothetical protein
MKNNKEPLKVALLGMDSRAIKTITLFLLGPCGNKAVVVANQADADILMLEGDTPGSKKLQERHVQEYMDKPLIILSLAEVTAEEGVLHLKKPVDIKSMLIVMDQAQKMMGVLAKRQRKTLSQNQAKNEIQTSGQAHAKPEGNVLQELDDWFDTSF